MTELGLLSLLLFWILFMKKRRYDSYSMVLTGERKKKLLKKLIITIIFIVIFIVIGIMLRYFFQKRESNRSMSVEKLQEFWRLQQYEDVYDLSDKLIEQKPMLAAARMYHGYAAYYLAIEQTEISKALNYIDECINSLRIVLINNNNRVESQINYILAKAYFQKNAFSSYNYYANLVIRYFLAAQKNGFFAPDIPEFLGQAYSQLGMTEESIAAFTEALSIRESESLLKAIGEQYYLSGDYSNAKPYMVRIIQNSKDDILVQESRNVLGKIYLDENNLAEAKKEFEQILQKNENYADAYYGLGIIYEKQGDMIKARSEWRKALRVQSSHSGAIQKLSNN